MQKLKHDGREVVWIQQLAFPAGYAEVRRTNGTREIAYLGDLYIYQSGDQLDD